MLSVTRLTSDLAQELDFKYNNQGARDEYMMTPEEESRKSLRDNSVSFSSGWDHSKKGEMTISTPNNREGVMNDILSLSSGNKGISSSVRSASNELLNRGGRYSEGGRSGSTVRDQKEDMMEIYLRPTPRTKSICQRIVEYFYAY